MKLEHLLKIYWAKGLFFNGKLNKLNSNFNTLFYNLNGFSSFSKNLLIFRLENSVTIKNIGYKKKNLATNSIYFKKFLNMFFSQIIPNNHSIFELTRFNLIRLYLIKSYRGKAQALGKPSHGQRSWSNAWSAFKSNKTLRTFISEIILINKLKEKKIVKDYRKIEKKYKKSKKKNLIQMVVLKNKTWF